MMYESETSSKRQNVCDSNLKQPGTKALRAFKYLSMSDLFGSVNILSSETFKLAAISCGGQLW